MPMIETQCIEGHKKPRFLHVKKDYGTQTYVCEKCGHTMSEALSMGRGLTYFEEGRGRWINNMGDQPVYITSHEQHKRIMKERGLTMWTPSRGMPGAW
jgi:DNA-directed RNA polymerase subunit RPC12/RpoP